MTTEKPAVSPIFTALLITFPFLAEMAFGPTLPALEGALECTHSEAVRTFTVYALGMGLGVLFWGCWSDRVGRKPALLRAFLVFALGCLGCFASTTVQTLWIFRCLMGFGAGGVQTVSQAVMRDAFSGKNLAKAGLTVGLAMSIVPLLGTQTSAFLMQHAQWNALFGLVLVLSLVFAAVVAWRLPETRLKGETGSALETFKRFVRDRTALSYGLITGLCVGMAAAYAQEAPFVLMTLLGLTPHAYGHTFFAFAAGALSGNALGRVFLQKNKAPKRIFLWGVIVIVVANVASLAGVSLGHGGVASVVLAQTATRVGMSLIMGTSFMLALSGYKEHVGTATSLFGFLMQMVVAVVSASVAACHDGTLFHLPTCFAFGACVMLFLTRLTVR